MLCNLAVDLVLGLLDIPDDSCFGIIAGTSLFLPPELLRSVFRLE